MLTQRLCRFYVDHQRKFRWLLDLEGPGVRR
jgi:hypothetical protein